METPRIDISALPEEEKTPAWNVGTMLSSLDGYADDFEADLVLFDNARGIKGPTPKINEMINRWPFIAARDGGMAIYHFGKVIEVLRASMRSTPTIQARVSHDLIKEAWKEFRTAFPLYDKIRHAIAHAGEIISNADENAINGEIDIPGAFRGKVTNGMFISNLVGRNFTTTFEREIISYSISSETATTLRRIERKIFDAFADACHQRQPLR